jgi:hypothetical protein
MVGINVTRSIRNLLQFGVLACAIVIVATFDRNCVIAQNSAPVLQNVHTVSGIVRMQGNGEAIAGARGRVVKKEDTYVVLGSNQATRTAPKREYSFTTDNNGRWSASDLPDGSYVIQVAPGITDSDRYRGPAFATKKQMITVAGTDLEGVLIEVSKGAKISGIVIVEGDEPFSSLTLDASKVDAPLELHQEVSKSLTPTGRITTFTLTDVPEGVIQMSVFFRTDSHYVKSMSVNGIDLLQEKLNLASGMDLKDVTIVVSSNLAEFTGRIISESGKTPLPRMKIFLDEIGKRRVLGGRLTRWIDEQGTFLLRPPPGEYRIYVYGDQVEGSTLPLVKSLPPMTFRPREQQNMEIRVP